MTNQAQLPPTDDSNINRTLDAIIAENGGSYPYAAQKSIFQRYTASMLARNPLAIIVTIIPVSLLIIGSVVAMQPNNQTKPNLTLSNKTLGPDQKSENNAVADEYEEVPASSDQGTDNNIATDVTPDQGQTDISIIDPIADLSSDDSIGIAPLVEPNDPDPQTPPTTAQIKSTFGIATWNTLYSNTASNVGSGARGLAQNGADIISFQEVYRPAARKNIRDKLMTCSGCTYSGYIKDYTSDGPTSASNPIVWNKNKFTGISTGYIQTNPPEGSGDEYLSAKWITWAKLKDRATSREFYIINTHPVASVESGGRPTGTTARLNNYRRHMDKLDQLIDTFQKTNLPIFVSGDFNVNYRNDAKIQYKDFPYARMNRQGIRSGWQQLGAPSGGTNLDRTRLIDYVMNSMNSGVTAQNIAIQTNRFGSDHSAVLMKFQLNK